MRREKVDDSMFVMDPSKQDIEKINLAEIIVNGGGGFGVDGNSIEGDSHDCLCKVVVWDSTVVYHARMDGAGSLYDPWGIDEGAVAKLNKQKGAENWPHRRVSRMVFEQYLAFLRTHNKAHLLNAQRTHR